MRRPTSIVVALILGAGVLTGCPAPTGRDEDALRVSNETDLTLTITIKRFTYGLSVTELDEVFPDETINISIEPCAANARFVATAGRRIVASYDPPPIEDCDPDRIWTITE